jgi:ribosomal protein L7Ae-like RNA K-turn-binding protein
MHDKFLSLLGMAQRAGALVSGTLPVTQNLKRRKGALLIVAADAAEEVIGEARKLASFANVKMLLLHSKVAIGLAIGKSPRALVLVTDQRFAARLMELSQ